MELSVRFFKRLILAALALMILIPVVLAVRFGLGRRELAKENALLADQLAKTQAALQAQLTAGEPDQPDPSAEGEAMSYQRQWPELIHPAQPDQGRVRETGTVYLTFDNSPSEQTGALLDALDQAGVKGTFFITGQNDSPETRERIKEIADRGHSLGVMSYTGDLRTIYTSVENFLEDFDLVHRMIAEAGGVETGIFRFPGGSVNSYNYKIYRPLIAEMLRRGFLFYDWNVSGLDNVRGAQPEAVAQAVVDDVLRQERAIVELRDGGSGTVEALPELVSRLQAEGYTFRPLTEEVQTIAFSYEQ